MKNALIAGAIIGLMTVGNIAQAKNRKPSQTGNFGLSKTVKSTYIDTRGLGIQFEKGHPIHKLINEKLKKDEDKVNAAKVITVVGLISKNPDDSPTEINVTYSPYSRTVQDYLSCEGTILITRENHKDQYTLINDGCEL